MDDNTDTSRVALKIVFVLSLILVCMDFLEFYYEYQQMKELSIKYEAMVFEECIKYHALSQMFFTFFATFSGISATIMSLGLLVDYEFFSYKMIDTFLNYNYLIFGPYLFIVCLIGFYNYDLILYNCDSKLFYEKKLFNFSTFLALLVCFLFSFVLFIGYSIFYSLRRLISSIRFTPEGNYILGRIFWRYVLSRNNSNINANRRENNNNIININAIN